MIQFRRYTEQAGITEDYHKVRAFFVELGYAEFEYARWDWMATHSYLDQSALDRIGLWEDAGKVVAVATFDTGLGIGFCLKLKGYEYLQREMLLYARENLAKDGDFAVVIGDMDLEFQDLASGLGFVATEEKDYDAFFYTDRTSMDYALPEGFRITSMKETFDLYQYRRVLWRGFNHELKGEGPLYYDETTELAARDEFIRPNVDLDLKIAVVAPDGSFVSYCGMWYEPDAGFAVVEPVATDPQYRRMGLGRAVVLEGVRRAATLGARKVMVGSMQQFYYSIGFRPCSTVTLWRQGSVKLI